ncbi:hypothetical protein RQP46_004985 [Phenoliferia psychrophenolica]
MGSQDPFHGYKDAAELCEHVITSLFSPGPSGNVGVGQEGLDTPPHSPVLGKEAPPPLGEFIAYALYRTRLPISITHQALLLLNRLKTRYPSARGTATSPHRLFLSSLMLSSKISMDDTYSNKSWQVVGQGLFSLREVNQMERELFAFLGWNVVVRDEELTSWIKDVVEPYELARGVAADVTPRKTMEDRKRRRDSTSRQRRGRCPSTRPLCFDLLRPLSPTHTPVPATDTGKSPCSTILLSPVLLLFHQLLSRRLSQRLALLLEPRDPFNPRDAPKRPHIHWICLTMLFRLRAGDRDATSVNLS